MHKVNHKSYSFVFFLLIAFTFFFEEAIIPVHRYVKLFALMPLFYFALKNRKRKAPYTKPVLLINLFILISCINSFISHGQKITGVLFSSYFLFGLTFFYILLDYKITYPQAKKILIRFSLLFCACYIIQWLVYPTPLFSGALDDTNITDDQFRMRMSCSMCAYVLFFYGFCAYFKTKKISKLFYSLLGFVPIIIMGFRSLIGLSIAFLFVMLIQENRHSIKRIIGYSLAMLLMGGIAICTSLVQDKVAEMAKRNDSSQTFDNPDYIRFVSFAYYTQEVFNKRDIALGGGMPVVITLPNKAGFKSPFKSKYTSKVITGLENGLYWVDLGMIGLTFIIGVPAICIFVYILLKCSYRAKSNKITYVRYAIMAVLLGSVFTSMEIYRNGNFFVLSILLYTEYRYNLESYRRHLKYVKKHANRHINIPSRS